MIFVVACHTGLLYELVNTVAYLFQPGKISCLHFLVDSFSSASFPLTEESVGVALQCCIGGHHLGFKVSKIFERSFRFSVAGNKVVHFIHGLKDRIWPDFICHFHLFNGRFNGFKHLDYSWHADERIESIAHRSPVAVRTTPKVFSQPTGKDHSTSKELRKFGLVPIASMDFADKNKHEASCSYDAQPA